MPDTTEMKRERRRRWKERDPEGYKRSQKNSQLVSKFGITIEDYDKMFETQKGLCGICERHQDNFQRSLAVDHCHHTGKVRGLLCQSCNSGLGKPQDDVDYLKSAILYLTQVVKVPDVPEVEGIVNADEDN